MFPQVYGTKQYGYKYPVMEEEQVSVAVESTVIMQPKTVNMLIFVETEAVVDDVSILEAFTISSRAAQDIETYSANLRGELFLDPEWSTLEYVDVFFEYRVAGAGSWTETSPKEQMNVSGIFNKVVTGLNPSTTYEFRAVGEYNLTTKYGSTLEFTTEPTVKVNIPVAVEARVIMQSKEASRSIPVGAEAVAAVTKQAGVAILAECEAASTVLTRKIKHLAVLVFVEAEALVSRSVTKSMQATTEAASTIKVTVSKHILATVEVFSSMFLRELVWVKPYLVGIVRKIDDLRGRLWR